MSNLKERPIYRGKANPNATNSELDAKVIIDHTKNDGNRDSEREKDEK